MRSALAIALWLTACGHEPPVEAPDPCPAARARYETARASGTCETSDECVPAPTIPDDTTHHEDGRIGRRDVPPCTPAAHRSSLAAVEAAARAFEAAGCGAVVPVHTDCGASGHGLHLLCSEQHRCETAY